MIHYSTASSLSLGTPAGAPESSTPKMSIPPSALANATISAAGFSVLGETTPRLP